MKKNIFIDIFEAISILALISMMLLVLFNVHQLQGTARVVNYTGIVRGATQRLIKLELMDHPNRDLELRLEGILKDLMSDEPGKNDLILLDDARYKDCLNNLATAWKQLRDDVHAMRGGVRNRNNVLEQSEAYFHLADNTVSAAEVYAQGLATKIQRLENVIIVLILLEVLMIIYRSVNNIILVRRNRELGRMAYIDAHTGLPNKSRCEKYLTDTSFVHPNTAVFVFDLNYLKRVNDELGHEAGDTLIKNFAILLRNNIPSRHFVGRFGGDEFIVIAQGVSEADVKEMCEKLDEARQRFNTCDESRGYSISFSFGYAMSDDFGECTYKTLFDKADFNMYEYKKAMKAQLGEDSIR